MRVLLIDDDPRVTALLERTLRRNDVESTAAADGPSGLEMATGGVYDAIVLDLLMPGWDGFETMRRIRSAGVTTPIIFLTGSDSTDNLVRALEGGGDDFIEKPFEPRELVARLRAVTRRSAGGSGSGTERRIRFADLEIDTLLHRAWWGDARIELTRTELRILQALTLADGDVVARSDLMRVGWGEDAAVGPESLGVHISNLRKRLSHVGADGLVETVRGRGYRLRATL